MFVTNATGRATLPESAVRPAAGTVETAVGTAMEVVADSAVQRQAEVAETNATNATDSVISLVTARKNRIGENNYVCRPMGVLARCGRDGRSESRWQGKRTVGRS